MDPLHGAFVEAEMGVWDGAGAGEVEVDVGWEGCVEDLCGGELCVPVSDFGRDELHGWRCACLPEMYIII